MKSILLHIHQDHGQDERIAVALDLARAHRSHLTCVQTTPFNGYMFGDPFGGVYTSPAHIEAIRDRNDEQRTRIEQRLRHESVSWDWESWDGDPALALVNLGGLADIIVLSRAEGARDDKHAPLSLGGDVAIHARAPVLVVPPGTKNFRCDGPVVIAWNGSIEVAHSLRLAMPLLRMASQVHLLTVAEGPLETPAAEGSRYLSHHGISADLLEWQGEGRSIAQTLAHVALEMGAACLVMGAYGHSRLRETILGGVTHDLLAETAVPLLLAH